MWLVQTLGYSWDEVHEEAERLEHVISEDFERRIAAAMGHPIRDPHGDLIPTEDLKMPEDDSMCTRSNPSAAARCTAISAGERPSHGGHATPGARREWPLASPWTRGIDRLT
jgi:DtxR family Mn-dependent transcriptional regulator